MARAKKVPDTEADTEVDTGAKKVSPKSKRSAEPVEPTKAKSKAKPKPAAKDEDDEDDGNELVTLASLCEERGLNPRDARIRLRRELERAEGARWEWEAEGEELDTVIGILDDIVEKREARAANKEDEAPAPKAKGKAAAKAKPAKGKGKAKPADDEDEDDEEDED